MIKAIIFDTDKSVKKLFVLFNKIYVTEEFMGISKSYCSYIHNNLIQYNNSYTHDEVVYLINKHILQMSISHIVYNLIAKIIDNSVHNFLLNLVNLREISPVLSNGFKCSDELRCEINILEEHKDMFLLDSHHVLMLLINSFTDKVFINHKEEFSYIVMEIIEKIKEQFILKHNPASINVVFINENYDPMVVMSINN
ncbi:MAG: hypothetical protein ACD_33C00014G0002 [uncultured bacterium]|nr:MAG: hypothetical protein ACD_33C00014G0002 [uncultured bacterium]